MPEVTPEIAKNASNRRSTVLIGEPKGEVKKPGRFSAMTEATVPVAVQRPGEVRDAGDFTLRDWKGDTEYPKNIAEKIMKRHTLLKEHGFPVAPTTRVIEKGRKVLSTDLSEGGTKKVLTASDLISNRFQGVEEITNREELEEKMRTMAQKADELNILLSPSSYTFVVDETGKARIVFDDLKDVATTNREKGGFFYKTSTEVAEYFIENIDRYSVEYASLQEVKQKLLAMAEAESKWQNRKDPIRDLTEQQVFSDPLTQTFFEKWCAINGDIKPIVIDRKNWDARRQNSSETFNMVFNRDFSGRTHLYIPENMRLGDLVPLIKMIDANTYKKNPELKGKRVEQLKQLGDMFRNTGVYLAKRVEGIQGDEEKDLEKAMAQDFYEYGESLREGTPGVVETKDLSTIGAIELTLEETQQVDQWLAGDAVFASRMKRAQEKIAAQPEKREEILEEERMKTLNQFFRVYQRSSEAGAFREKVDKQIEKAVETPKAALTDAVFQRGIEFLKSTLDMPNIQNEVMTLQSKLIRGEGTQLDLVRVQVLSSLISSTENWQQEEGKLRDILQIDAMKEQLDQVRAGGDIKTISEMERSIATKIQNAIIRIPNGAANPDTTNPATILATKSVNCVGATMLGGAFLKEVGIDYSVASVPGHSLLFYTTSDNKAYWKDMTVPIEIPIEEEDFKQASSENSQITVEDIIEVSRNQKGFLSANFNNSKYDSVLGPVVLNSPRKSIELYPPEIGEKVQVLLNLAYTYKKAGMVAESEKVSQEILRINPNDVYVNWLLAQDAPQDAQSPKAA